MLFGYIKFSKWYFWYRFLLNNFYLVYIYKQLVVKNFIENQSKDDLLPFKFKIDRTDMRTPVHSSYTHISTIFWNWIILDASIFFHYFNADRMLINIKEWAIKFELKFMMQSEKCTVWYSHMRIVLLYFAFYWIYASTIHNVTHMTR